MPRENIEKPAFASQLAKTDKRRAGRTKAEQTPIELRSGDETLGDGFRTWIHERLGRQLGKYAEQIERIEVRFGDENGPKGGIDKSCLIHAIVSSLPGIVVEERGADL